MSRRIVERKWENRNLYLEKGDLLLLLEEPTKPLITARTRHGRNIKIPLSILDRDNVHFNCQLCSHSSFPDYATYTAHLIEEHFRDQLMTGLDFTSGKGGMPSCPFPACNGTLWASLQALLMHYASHHHVLEKLMMYESELQCMKYRSMIEEREDEICAQKKKLIKLEQLLEQEKSQAAEDRAQAAQDRNQAAQALKTAKEKSKEGMDIQVITGVGSHIQIKEEPKSDIKKLFKTETVTNIENQTLKKEYVQIKREKEKMEKACELKLEEITKVNQSLNLKIQEYEGDIKSAVENGKKWKETCFSEEEKYHKELKKIQDQQLEDQREIENLKNIIEIGKSTVENAKQIANELDKENKKRQANEESYMIEIKNYEESLKNLETKSQQSQQEMLSLRDLVRYLSEKLEDKDKQNTEAQNNAQDLSEKYKNLLEVLKRKDNDLECLRSNMENCEVENKAMNSSLEQNIKSWHQEKQAMQHEFRKELEGVGTMLKDKSDNIKQLQDEVSVIRLKMEEAKKEARKLSVQVMQWKEKCQEIETEMKGRQEKHQIEMTEKESVLTETKLSMEKKQKELDAIKSDHEKSVSKLHESQTCLSIQLEMTKHAKAELEMKLTEANKNLDQSKSKINSFSRSEEEIRKKCENMSAELKVQGWEIDNYKRRLINSEVLISSLGVNVAGCSGSKMASFPFPPVSGEKFVFGGGHLGEVENSPFNTSLQNFIIPGVSNQSEPIPDPSLTVQQEEQTEYNELSSQPGDRILEASEMKQEINFTEDDKPTSTREWNLKRGASPDEHHEEPNKKKK